MEETCMLVNNTYLFIHGAWHAAWCWDQITQPLITMGHRVLAPDLPGHGTNWQPANTITFNDYVTSIITLIQQQPEQVTLIGHSMAGLIISQIAETFPAQIRELIFIAAYIPENNQSLLSIAEAAESRAISPFLIIDKSNQEIRLKSSPELASIFFNCCNEADIKYAVSRLQPQPLQPFIVPVSIGDNFNRISKRSFLCKHDRALVVSDQLRMSKAVTDNLIYLDADHSAYFSAANAITKALIAR